MSLQKVESIYQESCKDWSEPLINAIDQGVVLYKAVEGGVDFTIVDFNRSAEQMERINREEVLGRRITEVFPGVREFGLLEVLSRVYLSGKPESLSARKYDDGRICAWRENRVYRVSSDYVAAVYQDVTAREEARLAKSRYQERYRLLLESTLDGIWDWNIQENTVYFSPRWKAQLGFEDHELANEFESWSSRLHPEDAPLVMAKLDEFLTCPSDVWSMEFRLRCKNDSYVWTLARGTPVLNEAGICTRILGVHINIDEQKKNASKLAENEQRLTLALRAANQGLYDLNVQTGEALVSDEYAVMLGYDPQSFVETNAAWLERLHPGDHSRVSKTYRDYVNGKTSEYRVEFRLRTKNGAWVWILSVGSIVERDKLGEPLRLLGTHTDITELKLAQEKARQAAQVFRSTIEGVTITDLDGTIVDVNQAFSGITGYTRDDVVGLNSKILKSGKHGEDFYEIMWSSLAEQGSWRGEIWNRRKDGSIYPSLLTISRVDDENGSPSGYVGVFSDISLTKKHEEHLEYLAHHDPLTGLPNRMLFHAIMDQAISRAKRESETLAVLFIDLDRFKIINDTYGHFVGDELLRLVGLRLSNVIRGDDRVARISGDEFAAFLENVGSSDNAALVVRKIQSAFEQPFTIDNKEINVACSIGVSLYPNDSLDISSLIRFADTAMFRAKQDGRNNYQFYTGEMTEAATEALFLESAIANALRNQEFHLVYQPQVDLSSQKIIGLEALIRWHHPERGVIPPSHFIPFAEKVGLVREVGVWVLNEACRQASEWRKFGYDFGNVAVNISGRQVHQQGFAALVLATLILHDLPPKYLELEVTESFLMEHEEEGIRQLKELRDAGVSIAIDDFGTGYSSLSYLKHLPIDRLKIDQSFVRDIPQDANDMAIADAVISLGRAMGLNVIAEGIETSDQISFLTEKGCTQGQGYYYHRPLSVEALEKLFR